MKRLKSAAELEKLRAGLQAQKRKDKAVISICGGTGCQAYKSEEVFKAL